MHHPPEWLRAEKPNPSSRFGLKPATPALVAGLTEDVSETLARYVRDGGAAILLEGLVHATQGDWWKGPGRTNPLLPISARPRPAKGHWISISHVVKGHPIFDGLPCGGIMGTI